MASKQRKAYTIRFKLRVVEYAKEHGNRAAERHYGSATEKMIREWRKQEENLKIVRKMRRHGLRYKPGKFPLLEEAVKAWIVGRRSLGYSVPTKAIVCEARRLAKERNIPAGEFAGSSSWCYRFLKRHSLGRAAEDSPEECGVKVPGFRGGRKGVECEAGIEQEVMDSYLSPITKRKTMERKPNLHHEKGAIDDVDAELTYPSQLRKIINKGGYLPEQVFNVNETGLFWKRMPDRTYISEEKCTSGFKDSKDRLTLLLGINAAGDFKLKPLLMYSLENPKALMGYAKSSLPVIWHSNRRAQMTPDVYKDWFVNYFCPAVERYCAKQNIANKALLLLDNALNHQLSLSNISLNVRVEYLPRSTALIQPLDQGIISSFRRYYLRRTFRQLVQATEGKCKPSVRDSWKNYSIRDAINNIAKAWDEVQSYTVNCSWKSIWPDCANDFTGFTPAEIPADIHLNLMQLTKQAQCITEDNVVQIHASCGENVDVNEEPTTQPQYMTKDLSRTVIDTLTCYKKLYKKHRKEQSAVDTTVIAPWPPHTQAPPHIISGTAECKSTEEINEVVLQMNKENESGIVIKEEIKEEIELDELETPVKQNLENKEIRKADVDKQQLNFHRGYVEHRNVEEMNREFLELKRENELEMMSEIEIKEEDIKEEIEEENEMEPYIKQNSPSKKGMMIDMAKQPLSFHRGPTGMKRPRLWK